MLRGLPPEGVEDVPRHTVLEELLDQHLMRVANQWVDIHTARTRWPLHDVLQVAGGVDDDRLDRPWVTHQRRLWEALAWLGHPSHVLLPRPVLQLAEPLDSQLGALLAQPDLVDPAVLHVQLLQNQI